MTYSKNRSFIIPVFSGVKIFFVLMFAAGNILYSQSWTEQVSNVTVQLTSVSAVDFNNAWICGYSGTVLRTTNQGSNWLNVSGNGIPSNVLLVNIFGITSTTALAAGYIGSDTWVYRTSNAGANWVQVFAQPGGFINVAWIKLDNTGLMVGDPVGGRWSMWKTTNAGVNWDSAGLYLAQAGAETGYNNSFVMAQNRVWFGTNNSRIYYSTNNGTNWSVQSSAPEASVYSIWFDQGGSANGFFGGVNVYKTTDYGTAWTSIGSIGTGSIVGLAGLPMWSGNLWYVKSGNSNIYFGYGIGSWVSQYTAPAGTYRHITTERIPNYPFNGYAVRNNGGISHRSIFVEGINKIGKEIPDAFSLGQNYPNPFNPTTKIRFSLPLPSKGGAQAVKLVIYDILGREIASLIPRGQEGLSPGVYEVEFDGANYPSGVYFYKIFTENYSKTLKMVLIK